MTQWNIEYVQSGRDMFIGSTVKHTTWITSAGGNEITVTETDSEYRARGTCDYCRVPYNLAVPHDQPIPSKCPSCGAPLPL